MDAFRQDTINEDGDEYGQDYDPYADEDELYNDDGEVAVAVEEDEKYNDDGERENTSSFASYHDSYKDYDEGAGYTVAVDSDFDILKTMFPEWDDESLELVLSYSQGVGDAKEFILLTGSPDSFRRQLKDERKAAMNGELIGQRVLLVATGKVEIDGTYGQALKWNSEGWYSVKLEKNGKTAKVGPQCLKEVVKPVDKKSSTAALRNFDKALTQLNAGEVEAAIKLLKGRSAPPISWKHQEGGKVTWAAYQFSLGNAFLLRNVGARHTNLETAIYHLKGCLEVYTFNDYATQYAEAQYKLAAAFHEQTHGSIADNLAHAIFHYKRSLRVYDRYHYPTEYGIVQANLGIALRDRADVLRIGKPVEFNEHAHFSEIHTEEQLSGVVWHGAEEENAASVSLEAAIKHFHDALEVVTKQRYPKQWRLIMENVAICYADRLEGDTTENIERSVEYYRAANGGKKPDHPVGGRRQSYGASSRMSWRNSQDHVVGNSTDFTQRTSDFFAEGYDPEKQPEMKKLYRDSIINETFELGNDDENYDDDRFDGEMEDGRPVRRQSSKNSMLEEFTLPPRRPSLAQPNITRRGSMGVTTLEPTTSAPTERRRSSIKNAVAPPLRVDGPFGGNSARGSGELLVSGPPATQSRKPSQNSSRRSSRRPSEAWEATSLNLPESVDSHSAHTAVSLFPSADNAGGGGGIANRRRSLLSSHHTASALFPKADDNIGGEDERHRSTQSSHTAFSLFPTAEQEYGSDSGRHEINPFPTVTDV